jgi:hypothetical protein
VRQKLKSSVRGCEAGHEKYPISCTIGSEACCKSGAIHSLNADKHLKILKRSLLSLLAKIKCKDAKKADVVALLCSAGN